MGENVLNLSFSLSTYIAFSIGDYCTVFNQVYKLNALPVFKKTAVNRFDYTVIMQFEGYDLSKAQYLGLGTDNTLTESEFYLMGNADMFMDLLIQNMNRISSGWVKGQVIATNFKNLDFKSETCYAVLGRLSTEFNVEYWIEGKKIHLTKQSRDTGYKLSVGQNRGLYEITRSNVDSTRIITRLYPRGSDKNLPTDYVGTRLHLPLKPSHGNDCLISDITWFKSQENIYTYINWARPKDPDVTSIEMVWGGVGSGTFPYSATFPVDGPGVIALPAPNIFDPTIGAIDAKFVSHGGACEGQETTVITIQGSNPQPIFPFVPVYYIEKNVSLYDIIEESATFDDIYPHRTGTVTAVDAGDPFKIIDTGIDFDLNAQLLPGLTAQLTFLTGSLGGYSFDISSYDNGTKAIEFLKNKNEQSIDVPSFSFKAAIGDQYVLTNIRMPDAYIEAAQAELLAKAKDLLDTYSQPQYTISATLDIKYMKNYLREVFAGDTVWIKDTQIGIDRKIRITQVTRNLVETYDFKVTLSDVIEVGTKDKIFTGISTAQRSTSDLNNQVVTRDIFNGNLVLPTNPGGAGFENVIVEIATNKLYRKE
jgi:hypothetical protein